MTRDVAKNMTENNSDRFRNQPLGQRKPMAQSRIGIINEEQLADRQKQFQETKDAIKGAPNEAGQQAFNNQFKNRIGVGIKSPTSDLEQLIDRQTEETVNQKGIVTSIDDLRCRRTGGNLTNTPLADRKSLKEINGEAAAIVERGDMLNTELTDLSESGHKIHSVSQHTHEDKINDDKRD